MKNCSKKHFKQIQYYFKFYAMKDGFDKKTVEDFIRKEKPTLEDYLRWRRVNEGKENEIQD